MKIEMILVKDEVESILEQSRDDAQIEVSQEPEGNLLVSFNSVSLSKIDFAELVMQDYGLDAKDVSVEDMKLMPDGSVGLIMIKKVKL